MKKIVLRYGLISGAISALLMAVTVPFIYKVGFDYGMVVGYTAMLLAFLLVYFGVRSYRDTVGDGYITFFKGLGVGLLIALISTICYVITWEIVYFNFLPDFAEKYTNHIMENARAAGASPAELAAQLEQMQNMKSLYDNPLFNAAFTFLEPLPVGLLVSLVSAFILRRRRPAPPEETDLAQQNAMAG